MSIITHFELIDVQQRASERINSLMVQLVALDKSLKNLSDQELDKIFASGGSEDPAGDRDAFRAWQEGVRGFVDNYTGQGELSDKSLEIFKRIKPSI